MVRYVKRLAGALAVALVILSLSAMGLYRAVSVLPPEYAAVLNADIDHEAKRRELESQLAAVYSDAQREADAAARSWEAVVTDDQINGWLATRAPEELPELARAGVKEPRVVIGDGELMFAFRAERQQIDAVVMLRGTPLVADDGRLGVELTDAWLGVAPLPTGRIVELTRDALARTGLPAEWSHTDEGRPVLLVDFEALASDSEQRRTLTGITLSGGELHVVGQTERRPPPPDDVAAEDEMAGANRAADNHKGEPRAGTGRLSGRRG